MLRILLLLLSAGLLAASAAVAATDRMPPDAEREFQTKTMRIVSGMLTDARYSPRARPIKEIAEPTFLAYIDALDPQRLYLSAADLDALDRARAGISDAIQGKDLAPVFSIFSAYAARVEERAAFARARLAEPADYSAAGIWVPDRSALARVADQAALDEVWRRLVRNERLELHLAGQSEDAIRRILDARYAGFARQAGEMPPMEIFGVFANAFAKAVDPDSAYIDPRDLSLALQADARFVGVGMAVSGGFPFAVVESVVPGGPAEAGGVRPGERVLAIAEESGEWVDTVGQPLETVVTGMRGKAGTPLRLRLGSDSDSDSDQTREVTLVRARVDTPREVAGQSVVASGGRKIGVVKLPAFYVDFEVVRRGDPDARSSVADVTRLLGELKEQGVDGVLLDLRGNGGGALVEGVDMAALFLGRRPVVQIRETGGRVSVESGRADAVWEGPLAVLVDNRSAAASEIVAAALQDHGRALVLGERTFARGSVQSLIDLDRMKAGYGGFVKLTVADFFRVDGRAIGAVGIEPDLPLPDAAAAESRPGAVVAAGRIPVAPGFKPLPPRPRSASARLPDDPEFAAWRERWQRARATRSANAVALDATTRRAAITREKADAEAGRLRDDALQAAAVAFAEGLQAPSSAQ